MSAEADEYGVSGGGFRVVTGEPATFYGTVKGPGTRRFSYLVIARDMLPAGSEAVLQGVELASKMTDDQNGQLNPLGVNCLRAFPVYGNIAWGARTLSGADQLQSQWKYVNVRRLVYHIEESLYQALKWAVFEGNDENLWREIRQQVGGFLSGLFVDGAFAGTSPDKAYFVHCDSTTTTAADIANGIVNIVVGIAPIKPAEFIILQIEQIAGQD